MRDEKPKESLGDRETSFDLVLSNFERLQAQARTARSHITFRSEETLIAKRVVSSVERQTLHHLVKRAPPPVAPSHSATSQEVADRLNLHDPLFTEQ